MGMIKIIDIPEPPQPPLIRFIRDNNFKDVCDKCGSTNKRRFSFLGFNFGKIKGCYNPECKSNIKE